jgi:aspartyl-tRNA(Asn)/glutamyl-tRNA(Gln) amidotransferase subunit B
MIHDLQSTHYDLVCGAEIHVELKTKSKMFCGCKNDPFHAEKPNIYTCPVCLVYGGYQYPTASDRDTILRSGLHCEIASTCTLTANIIFTQTCQRLPNLKKDVLYRGYESQQSPNHIHLEDAAKMHHAMVTAEILIDYNRFL